MPDPSDNISVAVTAVLEAVAARASKEKLEQPGLNLWMSEILARFSGIAERVAPQADTQKLRDSSSKAVAAGDFGSPLSADEVLAMASDVASKRASEEVVARDLLEAVLTKAGVAVAPRPADAATTGHRAAEPAEKPGPEVEGTLGSSGAASTAPSVGGTAGAPAAAGGRPAAKSAKPTPTLDKLGRDLVAAARDGRLQPALGRDAETQTLIEVLCRTRKRNPLLIGPAGSGKTAIVESFACRVAAGEVPEFLRDVRVVALETTTLVSGTQYAGSFEERVQKIVAEASQPGVILFVDEAHSVVSTGGRGTNNMADAFKPALARGDLALIGATTDDEYREYIRPDKALERRFQPIPVAELGTGATLVIMLKRRDALVEERGVRVSDDVVEELLRFADENMRNRTFPDKGLDLLEQCVAYGAAQGLEHIDAETARVVLKRLVGILITPGEALGRLTAELQTAGVDAEDGAAIVRRLNATLNGLDLRAQRPNLVLGLTGAATRQTGALARAFARALYGADDRVIEVDLSQIQDDAAISVLVGSMPGYVGYGRRLAIHALEVTPRAVVVFPGADVCHPVASEIVAKGLADGYITDTAGIRYYMSDAVVFLPRRPKKAVDGHKAPLGFAPAADDGDAAERDEADDLAAAFGETLAGQIDIVLSRLDEGHAGGTDAQALRQLLQDAAARYERRGIRLTWDDSVVTCLAELTASCDDRAELEKKTEEWLSSLVLPAMESAGANGGCSVSLTVTADGPQAGVTEAAREGAPEDAQ